MQYEKRTDGRTSVHRRSGKKRKTRFRFQRAARCSNNTARARFVGIGVLLVALCAATVLIVLSPRKMSAAGTEALEENAAPVREQTLTYPFASGSDTLQTAGPTDNPLQGTVIKTAGERNAVLPAVQERLAELYYMDTPAGGYTDRYDADTKIAVLLFQIKNYSESLYWDGQLGPGTYALLMSDQAKAYYLERGDGDSRTSNITKLVNDIKRLQDRLIELKYMTITRASGYYGQSTADAVQTFQRYHGLTQDGRAGAETLTMLYSDDAMDAPTGRRNDRSTAPPSPAVTPGPTA